MQRCLLCLDNEKWVYSPPQCACNFGRHLPDFYNLMLMRRRRSVLELDGCCCCGAMDYHGKISHKSRQFLVGFLNAVLKNAPKLKTTHRKSQNPIALKCLENTLFWKTINRMLKCEFQGIWTYLELLQNKKKITSICHKISRPAQKFLGKKCQPPYWS